jgi:hypothetical protein
MAASTRKAIAACVLASLLIPSFTAAAKKWEKKPYTQWSLFEVREMLQNSPWGISAGVAPFEPGPANGFYQVRLLTARPIEEALLRLGALESSDPTVSIEEIQGTEAEKENIRLQKYLASEKGRLMSQLDRQFIVVSLTIHAAKELVKDPRLPYRFADLRPPTTLSTDTGRRVRMIRFIPPDKHELGAIFYFPRNLPNGSPLVTAADKELQFKVIVKGNAVTAKFSLKKMVYKDKLEY